MGATNRNTADARRRAELAKIHIAANRLGWDRPTYEAMLWAVARVHSAADLDAAGRARVLDHLKALGAPEARRARPTPAPDRELLVRKVRAMLASANRPPEYGDALAKRMFNVERFEWCQPEQLRRLVAALAYDAQRHGRRA